LILDEGGYGLSAIDELFECFERKKKKKKGIRYHLSISKPGDSKIRSRLEG
jgi:hypothetical protein